MGDFDDFGELYADLGEWLIAGVSTAEAVEEDRNEMEERAAGYENGAMESESNSDSEDDLQIVLNEEDCPKKLPAQLLPEGSDFEEDEGDDLIIVTGSDCSGKEPKWAEQVHSADGLLQGNGDRGNATKGAHINWSRPCLSGSAGRSWSGRGRCDHLTVPCSLSKTSYNPGFPMAFSNGCGLYLPRNWSIFNIDVESLEYKPWRFNGVDITDYFNFGLDEEGWRTYCSQLPTGIVSGEVVQHGRDGGLEILDYLDNGRKIIKAPKGRAIQVESGGNGDRIPSIDVRRPRNRDSDVVIQITTGVASENAMNPVKDRITHMDDNGSKNELLLNSKNELCKSSFSVGTSVRKCEGRSNSSECPLLYMTKLFDEKLDNMNCGRDCPSSVMSLSKPDAISTGHYTSSPKSSCHNGTFQASRDEVSLEKVASPECIHLNSDSLLQESVLSHCYPSSDTGTDTSKTDRTLCGSNYPKSMLDLDYCQHTTICNVVELNHISDDEVAYPRQKIDGEDHTKDGTIVKQWDDERDEKGHSSQVGKISLKNSIKNDNENELNATGFLACSKDHKEDLSLLRKREKRSTAREVKTRKNGCHSNRRAQLNSRAQDIVNRDYLQTISRNMSLYDKRGCCTSRRAGGHDMITKAHYNSMEAIDRHREGYLEKYRERSLEKCFARCVPYFDEEDERFIDKLDRDFCRSGALKRLQELDSYDKTLYANLERSSRYAYNYKDSRIYGGGLHPRIYREAAYDEEKRGCHEDDSHRNQVPCLFKSDKIYMCHSGQSHTRERFSHLRSKHRIVSSKKYRLFSRTCFNLDDDRLPAEVKEACPDNRDYTETRKNSLALPGLLAKEEASIGHQDSNLSSCKKYNLYGAAQHQNGRVDKRSFSEQKIYDNHCHNSSGNKLAIRSGNDSDSKGCFDSLSDNFVKARHELDNWGCRQAVNDHLNDWKVKTKEKWNSSGGRSHVSTDIASLKESRDPNNNEKSSYYSAKTTSSYFYPTNSKVGYSNQIMTKCSNKHPNTEVDLEELEEGQLVEESDNHETSEIKCNTDGRTQALAANAMTDLTYPSKKKKLLGRYDRDHLLETLAKMEKRLERFKDPIPLKKEPENCGNMQPVAAIDEVKRQRPARKRRWGGS